MIKITQPKIKNQTDSFFYDGEIASIKKSNGTILSLIAVGDIRIIIDNNSYRNNQVDEAIREHSLTDKKLNKLSREGKIEWVNNNWFEVLHLKKGSNTWDCDMGIVAHNYDDAITLLKSYEKDKQY